MAVEGAEREVEEEEEMVAAAVVVVVSDIEGATTTECQCAAHAFAAVERLGGGRCFVSHIHS